MSPPDAAIPSPTAPEAFGIDVEALLLEEEAAEARGALAVSGKLGHCMIGTPRPPDHWKGAAMPEHIVGGASAGIKLAGNCVSWDQTGGGRQLESSG